MSSRKELKKNMFIITTALTGSFKATAKKRKEPQARAMYTIENIQALGTKLT